jgi:hypothetical protein
VVAALAGKASETIDANIHKTALGIDLASGADCIAV